MENRKKYGTQEWSNFFNSLHLNFFHTASDKNSLDAKILKSIWSLRNAGLHTVTKTNSIYLI